MLECYPTFMFIPILGKLESQSDEIDLMIGDTNLFLSTDEETGKQLQ